jgi:type I restriction enzyme S subunit
MNKLPPGWCIAQLSDLVSARSGNGKLIKGRLARDPQDGYVPAFSASGQDVWAPAAEYDGDGIVLSAVGARCGKAFLTSGSWTAIANTHVLLPARGVEARFLWYLLNDERFWVRSGSAQPFVKVKASLQKTIAVPPTAEQRRIVAAIEEHLSRLDAAEGLLRRAAQRLNSLRRSALEEAVSGAWPVVKLGDVILSLRNGIFVSRPAHEPPGTAIFRISAVRPMTLDANDVRYAPVAEADATDFLVQEGDLLFTRYSGNPEYVGACARVRVLPRPTLYPDKLIRVVVDRRVADPAFVELACATGPTLDAIRARRKTTAGQVGIAGGQLKAVPIPVPPLHDQQRIVAAVEHRLSVVAAMATTIATSGRRSASLRRAILERAFQGELVGQDPSDEPASALIAQIRADRAASIPAGRRR